MFNVCRRGPASIARVTRLSSSLIQTRPSILLATRTPTTFITSRQFHISFVNRSGAAAQEKASKVEEQNDAPQQKLISKFQELVDQGLVSKNVIDEITRGMGHHTMTDVQRLTINQTLKGTDIIAQARTGTGKTLGFLIPVVQSVLNDLPELETPSKGASRYSRNDRSDRNSRFSRSSAKPSDIRAIIMSPTRELAEQIAVEAKKITRNTSIQVQVAVGGNSKSAMLKQMQKEGCHILVATPGRLFDLLSDPYSRVAAPNLTSFVLDEADRLLDDGFSKDIEEIMTLLPDRKVKDRQTLLFSATIPREVMTLVRSTLKRDFQFVETVKEGELATHEKIPQNVTQVSGYENLMPSLLELSKREITKYENNEEGAKPFKAIVYHTSTANVILCGEIFQNLRSGGDTIGRHPLHTAQVSVIHARLSQQQRTRVSERFRRAKTGILFSTDVTARGMDFPGVSHVVQIGLPPSKDQYIHRVGRTGRGHSSGEGWIMLTPIEMPEARKMLRGIPIKPNDTLEVGKVDMTKDAQLPAETAETLKQISDATLMVDPEVKHDAYMGILGVNQRVQDKQAMMESLVQWTRYGWGMDQPPHIGSGLAQRLGLDRTSALADKGRGFGGGRGRSSGGFGGDRGRSSGGFGGDQGRSSGGFGGDRGRSSEVSGGRGGFSDRGRGSGGFGGDSGRSSGGFGGDRGRSSGGFGGDRGRSSGGFGGDRGRTSGGFGDRGKTAGRY